MAIIVLCMGCLLGALAAAVQIMFFGTSLAQAVVSYFAVSFGSVVAMGALAGLARWRMAPKRHVTQPSFEQQLEDWQDWHFEEDAAAEHQSDKRDVQDPFEDRKSA